MDNDFSVQKRVSVWIYDRFFKTEAKYDNLNK